jgi:hypothetical protein
MDELGADDDAWTTVIRLQAIETRSKEQFADTLQSNIDPKQSWAMLTARVGPDGKQFGLAMPVSKWSTEDALLFPFVEIHTLLIAWWLGTVWRTRQLMRASWELSEHRETISAAACVRPLVETAAAAWVDGRRLVDLWNETKLAGKPDTHNTTLDSRNRLLAVLNEVSWGAKFDERAPELKDSWGAFARSNVLGQVDKLSKAAGSSLQENYQWLCNTVHPSIGNTLAFSSHPLVHKTRTHALSWLSPDLAKISTEHEVHPERTIHIAIANAAIRSIEVLTTTLDISLRVIDDLALTTGAATVTPHQYWRNIVAAERNDQCPCRSTMKAKRCRHVWGEPSLLMNTEFPALTPDAPIR